MCFFGHAALHGFVVGVLARVVVYFKLCRLKSGIDLGRRSALSASVSFDFVLTFLRTASSTGVRDMVEIRLVRMGRRARNIGGVLVQLDSRC